MATKAKSTSNAAVDKYFEALTESYDALIDAIKLGNERGFRMSTNMLTEAQRGQREAVELGRKFADDPTDVGGFYRAMMESTTKAQGRALEQRPELKEAEFTVKQAELDRRMAKADFIPEVGVAFNYASNFNVDVLPRNMTSLGFQLKWEPWDWGRRKDVVNEKKATELQAQTKLTESRSQVLMEVNTRFRKLQESRVLIAVAQSERDAAQQKLEEVTNKFGQQAVLLSDVLRQQAAAATASRRSTARSTD